MKLLDLIQRSHPPTPWHEGDNIPWHELAFSERMLIEHLAQAHDHASRRNVIINEHVAWIHQVLLRAEPSRILDLGCGPGLYSNRLAALGHTCVGIDYSPASIRYARERATQEQLPAGYVHEDIRVAEYGDSFNFAMLIFGELNVFSRRDALTILTKIYHALHPGGLLLLEPHLLASLKPAGNATNTWFSSTGGLFSPAPHLVLIEEHWEQPQQILTRRYYVIDAASAEVTRYAQSMQSYTPDQYEQLLAEAGFTQTTILPGLAHDRIPPPTDFCAILARRPS